MAELTKHHSLFTALEGQWTGKSMTYLQPGELANTGESNATITTILGGSFLDITYDHKMEDEWYDGKMILGFHKPHGKYEMSWIDQYHMRTGIMYLEGDDPDVITVKGSYAAGNEVWGWSITIVYEKDALEITHHNIHPDGQSYIGVQTTYERK